MNLQLLDYYYIGVIFNVFLLIVTDNDNMKRQTRKLGLFPTLLAHLFLISLSWIFSIIIAINIYKKFPPAK